MPIFCIDHRGGLAKRSYERSPVIALETDAASASELPAELLLAADSTIFESLAGLRSQKLPNGLDAVLTWLRGESFLQGSAAAIRHDLRVGGRRCFVPVHLACLEEMPLLTIQPRWFRAGPQRAYWNFGVRLESPTTPSDLAHHALQVNTQPWAQLARAVYAGLQGPETGLEALAAMWQNGKQLPPMLVALVLRNLAVLLIRHKELAKAEQLLELGMKTYPGYAELSYLAALLHVRQERASQALPYLQRAKSREPGYLGCGGESTYRADWLLGLLAARVGNHRVAFDHLLQGLLSRPVFLPAVEELLNLRLPPSLIAAHQWDFCRAVRRAPQLLDKVFEYLLLHRAFDAARRIIQTFPLTAESAASLRDRLDSAAAPFRPGPSQQSGKPGILLNGPFFEHSSLARINRELAASLLGSSRWEVCLEPVSLSLLPPQTCARGSQFQRAFLQHPAHLDLTIRQQWPPDFQKPPRGKLAVVLPWEYGAVPRCWVEQIERNVDELWVPSRFVRDVFVRCGTSSARVNVIPNGIDPAVFTPEGPALRPQGARKFLFLFVGGAIRRKGVDLLLEAYKAAFDPGEDVTLVFNISGATGAYQHNSLTRQIQEAAADPRFPQVLILSESLDDATLASLYRACDAFVLPYRGEGFGMPLLEAMACGKPVITTAEGPAKDFCTEKIAYLISCREELVPDEPPPLGELAGEFTWFEPEFRDLVQTLRRVFEHPGEAASRGRAAANSVREEFSWSRISRLYKARIQELLGPQHSRAAPAPVPSAAHAGNS